MWEREAATVSVFLTHSGIFSLLQIRVSFFFEKSRVGTGCCSMRKLPEEEKKSLGTKKTPLKALCSLPVSSQIYPLRLPDRWHPGKGFGH